MYVDNWTINAITTLSFGFQTKSFLTQTDSFDLTFPSDIEVSGLLTKVEIVGFGETHFSISVNPNGSTTVTSTFMETLPSSRM